MRAVLLSMTGRDFSMLPGQCHARIPPAARLCEPHLARLHPLHIPHHGKVYSRTDKCAFALGNHL